MSALVLFLGILGIGFLALVWLGVASSIALMIWGRSKGRAAPELHSPRPG